MEETEETMFKQTSVLPFKYYTQYSTLNIFFMLYFTTFTPYIFAYLNRIYNLSCKRKKQLQFAYTFSDILLKQYSATQFNNINNNKQYMTQLSQD